MIPRSSHECLRTAFDPAKEPESAASAVFPKTKQPYTLRDGERFKES